LNRNSGTTEADSQSIDKFPDTLHAWESVF